MRIAIVGASRDPRKFGHRALKAYLRQGHEVFPINPHADQIEGVPAYPSLAQVPPGHLDRVLFYVPPHVGIHLLDELATRDVGEIWINPGAESDELLEKARRLGLTVVYACAILDIGENPHSP